jgi:hypothetical protein
VSLKKISISISEVYVRFEDLMAANIENTVLSDSALCSVECPFGTVSVTRLYRVS